MKRYFLIAIFPVIGLLTAPVFSDEPNPFREGTEKKTLTEEEKQSLLQYANTSKTTLERAKREAQGKPLQETLDIYVNAITSVVLKSFNEEKRRELLMRVSLNQALQLTTGIPTADGRGVEEEGVLTHAPLDLIAAILENAIDLALSYYPKDKEAIEAGDLLKLPFFEYAAHRLAQAKSWLTGIHSWQLQLKFEKAILEQWKTSVLSDQNLERERIAPLILDVEEALAKVNLPQYTVSQKVRFLRGVIRQLLEDSAKIMPDLRITSSDALLGEFAQIRAGTFEMGSPSGESGRFNDETLHTVTLNLDFEMMTTEVTQKQWEAVMRKNPSGFKGENHPVENVSWDDVQSFIQKLNGIIDNGYSYRLPTEAEWEYAARAGTQTAYSFGDNSNLLSEFAWFSENSGEQTQPVAQKKPNAFGLYDMHGNVSEWTLDIYSSDYSNAISQEKADDVQKSPRPDGSNRVFRGGGWSNIPQDLRSAYRLNNSPDNRYPDLGFRVLRVRQESAR